MKKRGSKRSKMRTFFTVTIVIEVILIISVSGLILSLLHKWFHITYKIPDIIWIVLLSFVLSCCITAALGKLFFDPVTELRRAMRRVTEGDFSVRLDESNSFDEIRQMNSDFNIMAKELGATEILQTDFVSNVSHEFKTPISAIEGYATLLHGEDCSETQAEYAEKILLNTKRLSSLVGNILLLSKVDNQGIPTAGNEYRLDEQIRRSLLSLEPLWAKKETDFEVDLESITYTGNEALMLHIWNNLIENAVKFTPQGGQCRITLKKIENAIEFSISDNGPGIPEESISHIFDRFYQADSSHKSEGNGLGLALVKQIVRLANGEISVINLPYGGCKFTVTLNI